MAVGRTAGPRAASRRYSAGRNGSALLLSGSAKLTETRFIRYDNTRRIPAGRGQSPQHYLMSLFKTSGRAVLSSGPVQYLECGDSDDAR